MELDVPKNDWTFPNKGAIESEEKLYYHTMTKKDVEEKLKKNDIIIIPVGSTENHGNAGPIGEDTFICTRMAEMVARKTGATIASPIWYGSHPFHHIGQPLTVPLPDSVFIDYLRAIMTGLWNTGFRKQIFISMHGQEYSLPVAIQEWGKRYQVPAMFYFVDIPRVMAETLMDKKHGGPYDRPFQHACEAEQSISLALFPEFCDQAEAENTDIKGILPRSTSTAAATSTATRFPATASSAMPASNATPRRKAYSATPRTPIRRRPRLLSNGSATTSSSFTTTSSPPARSASCRPSNS
ncbi:MAG: creatininase family protein [Planctomycetes bacterium]|nr:creatininase family protein [Planctomycetota bacterium]